MKKLLWLGASIALLAFGAVVAHAEGSGFGIRAGIGTDISGGIAYGGGINYLMSQDDRGAWELGLVAYGGSFEETTTEYFTYVETTDVFAIGVVVNRLLKYTPGERGVFVALGLGAGAISVSWEETSDGDITLGTPLPGGGSSQSADGTSGGMIVNLGVGYSFSGPLDLRLEAPIIYNFDAPGNSSSVIPTLTLTAGLRF
jgi:hypothetical protein